MKACSRLLRYVTRWFRRTRLATVSLALGLWFAADIAVSAFARSYLQSDSASTGIFRSLMLATLCSYVAIEWTDQLQVVVEFKHVQAKLTGAAAGFAVGLVLGLQLHSTFLIDNLERLLAYYQ
jgi:hypothetical protein